MAETARSVPTLPGLSVVPSSDDDRQADEAADVVLPGFESEDHVPAGPLERAVVDTLREYHAAELLKPRDAGKVALALDLCRVMAIKRRSGRTSTYSNDARLLSEILDSFVAEESAGDAAITEAMQAWSAYLEGLRATPPAS